MKGVPIPYVSEAMELPFSPLSEPDSLDFSWLASSRNFLKEDKLCLLFLNSSRN